MGRIPQVRPRAIEHHFAWALDSGAEDDDHQAPFYDGEKSLFDWFGLPIPHGARVERGELITSGYLVIAEIWCSRPDVELVLEGDGKRRVFIGPWLCERRPPAPYEPIIYAPATGVRLSVGRVVNYMGWSPFAACLRVTIRPDATAIEQPAP